MQQRYRDWPEHRQQLEAFCRDCRDVKGKLECGWIFRRGLRVHQLAHELDYRVNAAFAFTRIFYASDFSKRAAGYAHIRYIPPNPQASQQILEKS
jgi:hypothetical protein